MSDPDYRRGKITDEHLQEAAALRQLWKAKKPELEERGLGTHAKFGERFGIGKQAVVGFFLSGKTALSLKAGIGFARGLGVQLSDFSPRLAAMQRQLTSDISALSPDLRRLIEDILAITDLERRADAVALAHYHVLRLERQYPAPAEPPPAATPSTAPPPTPRRGKTPARSR